MDIVRNEIFEPQTRVQQGLNVFSASQVWSHSHGFGLVFRDRKPVLTDSVSTKFHLLLEEEALWQLEMQLMLL